MKNYKILNDKKRPIFWEEKRLFTFSTRSTTKSKIINILREIK